MLTLADASIQLDETTKALSGTANGPASQDGIALIDKWAGPLGEVDMTQPLAETLGALKTQLQGTGDNKAGIQETVTKLAQQVSEISSKMGAEGEMPSLLEGLASALRQLGEVSKTDTANATPVE
ncbi:MAG: hypothetical protein EAZ91_04850 [Cytophagales bacterium]|nr:MAG: hypothetical protein EAZ91_04850 [Cytophagales bacterium]